MPTSSLEAGMSQDAIVFGARNIYLNTYSLKVFIATVTTKEETRKRELEV